MTTDASGPPPDDPAPDDDAATMLAAVRAIRARYHRRLDTIDLSIGTKARRQLALDLGFLVGVCQRLMADAPPLGATGTYPRGHLDADDEGGIRVGVTARRGTVVLAFGTPVAWLGLPPQMARAVAASLLEKADVASKAQ